MKRASGDHVLKISFLAKSSEGDPYTVLFEVKNKLLTIFCNCQAGVHRRLCKHKVGLSAADESFLFNEAQKGELTKIKKLIDNTEIFTQLLMLNEANLELEITQKKIKKIKASIEKIMLQGIPV